MPDVLVLVVEVFAPLGEADGGETFEIEAGVVAATEIAVGAKDEDGVEGLATGGCGWQMAGVEVR